MKPFGIEVRAIALVLMLVASGPGPQSADKAAKAAPAPAAAPLAPGQIDTLKRIRETGAILIGVRESSVPFSFLDANKSPQGYSVDICLKVADAIKAELKMPRLEI